MEHSQESFVEIYREHAQAIYRHCLFRVYSPARAEDLMQDIFIKFWHYGEEGHDIQNPKGLLYRIADHAIIDEKRKRTTESLDALTEDDGFDVAGSEHHEVETQVLYREALRELKTLGENEQRLFVMRFVDDLDPKEIAVIMETTANTVSVQLNRITEKLRKKIT